MEQGKGAKALKIIIIVLSVLLALSLIGLGASWYLQRDRDRDSTATVTQNSVGSVDEGQTEPPQETGGEPDGTPAGASPDGSENTEEVEPPTGLELSKGNETENQPFSVSGMLPGDRRTMDYTVDVYHQDPVTVHFDVRIQEQTNRLGDVLMIRIEDEQGRPLYDGSFNEYSQSGAVRSTLPAQEGEKDTLRYRITAYLPTSVGNEYAASLLTADFIWSVPEGSLTSPNTGDSVQIVLIAAAALSALGLIAALAAAGKKGDVHNG